MEFSIPQAWICREKQKSIENWGFGAQNRPQLHPKKIGLGTQNPRNFWSVSRKNPENFGNFCQKSKEFQEVSKILGMFGILR